MVIIVVINFISNLVLILAVALVLALVFGRRKQTTKTFKVPDQMANTNDFQRLVYLYISYTRSYTVSDYYSTTNPLYDEAQNHSNIYDHLRGGDGVSVTDTITASMLDYCDDEKKLVN